MESLRNCEFLLALHLSDNRITQDIELYYDCLEEFHITDEDLIEVDRSKRREFKQHPNEPRRYDKIHIDYKMYLEEYFGYENSITDNQEQTTCYGFDHEKAKVRKLYKDRILLGKQQKIVDRFKAIN